MMAKNVENYIADAIIELQQEMVVKWELIIIDDHSSDATYQTALNFAKRDCRIIVKKNKFIGKVLGTNYGYTLTSGEIIKCIDSDDVLINNFFNEYQKLKLFDAHYHDAYIVNEKLVTIGLHKIGKRFKQSTYKEVVENIISLPKAYWSFKREIADKIFPMPEGLPLEDEWISFVIKNNAKKIYYIEIPLYLYRQHDNQDYGGILNYSIDKVSFRASRLLKVITILKNTREFSKQNKLIDFQSIEVFLLLQSMKVNVIQILTASITIKKKLKLILIMKMPKLVVFLIKLKWFFKSA
jgi:glycosyltransferase involved in cell wall biosynthesis